MQAVVWLSPQTWEPFPQNPRSPPSKLVGTSRLASTLPTLHSFISRSICSPHWSFPWSSYKESQKRLHILTHFLPPFVWAQKLQFRFGCSVARGGLRFLTRDGTCIPCVGRRVLDHWTTSGVSRMVYLMVVSTYMHTALLQPSPPPPMPAQTCSP